MKSPRWIVLLLIGVGCVLCFYAVEKGRGLDEDKSIRQTIPVRPESVPTSPLDSNRRGRSNSEATGSVDRFASPRLNRLVSMDCVGFFEAGVNGNLPELAALDLLLKPFQLKKEEHCIAIRRIHEATSDLTVWKEQRRTAVDTMRASLLRESLERRDSPVGLRSEDLADLERIHAAWDIQIAETRSMAMADLQEILGVIDPEWLTAVLSIPPSARAFPSDLSPLDSTPTPPEGGDPH
jgi:hypothetical protein